MVSCDICRKEFKNPQGLRGHKIFVHFGKSNGTDLPVTGVATEQPVSMLEGRFEKLERVTGLRESDPGFPLSDGELPLTDRLINATEQLSGLTQQLDQQAQLLGELTQQVSKLGEDLEIAKSVSNERLAGFVEQVESLDAIRKDAHNKLVAIVNSNGEQLKKFIDTFNGKFATIERNFVETNKRLDNVEAQLAKNQDASIKSIEQVVTSLKADIDDIRLYTLRKPTGDVVSHTLTDKRDHRFKGYRGSQGLRRPHKTTTDWILGDKYIDLSEPED